MNKTLTPVEQLIDVDDPSTVWYDIPLFEGYQITNNDFSVRKVDGSMFGKMVKSTRTVRNKYRGDKYVIIHLSDGRKVHAKNCELWDLVVRANMPQKTTYDAEYTGDYDMSIFPDCNSITGLPENFKMLGSVKRKGGITDGTIYRR